MQAAFVRRHRFLVRRAGVAGLVTVIAALGAPAVAQAGQPASDDIVATVEEDCVVVETVRQIKEPLVRPLVPQDLTLWDSPQNANANMWIFEIHCAEVRVDGQQHGFETIVHMAAVILDTSFDGTNEAYLLWYGTDNPVLAARYRQLGLPVEFVPRSSITRTTTTEGSTFDVDIVGGGLDHTITTMEPTVPSPTDPVVNGRTHILFDGPKGRLVLSSGISAEEPAGASVLAPADWSTMAPERAALIVTPTGPRNRAGVFTYSASAQLHLISDEGQGR